MKLAPLPLLLLLLPTVALGRDSAYKALRTLGNDRGQPMLNRVIEVTGRNGTPEPANWKIVVDDPAARGGVREFEVQNSRITMERTPVKTYSGSAEGAVMNFQKLNLDSAGAFAVAEKEANKAHVGFDSIDYVLRTDDSSHTPVWILRLADASQSTVGTLRIAADDGRVLFREGFSGRSKSGPRPTPTPTEPRDDRLPDNPDEDVEVNPHGIGHNIKKGFLKAGASLEEFFTGKRTLDRRYEDEQ